MNYYFSNLNYPRPESSQMDFFDSTFDENVSSDFLTLLSQENGFLDEDDFSDERRERDIEMVVNSLYSILDPDTEEG